jgi:hypothetical protein
MGPRAGLDNVEKRKFLTLPGLELRLLGLPARSQSLCFCIRENTIFNVKSSVIENAHIEKLQC